MIPVSAEAMRELDKMAEAQGISPLSLMENAGEAVSKKAAELLSKVSGTKVAIFCGKGNNGGDGFVAALKLAKRGFLVDVYLMGQRKDVKNEAAVSIRSFMDAGGRVHEIISEADIEQLKNALRYPLIIDALLGTGFSGKISGLLRTLVELLNSSGVPILAVDVPSGLNSTTGDISPIAVTAKWTISFGLPKKGFYKNRGAEQSGELEVVNIGFPDDLLKKAMEFEKKKCATLQ